MCIICLLLDKSLPNPSEFKRALTESNISVEHEKKVLDKLSEKVDNIDDYVWELHKDSIEPFGRQ